APGVARDPAGALWGAGRLGARPGGGRRAPRRQQFPPRAEPRGHVPGVLLRGGEGGGRVDMLRNAFRLHRWGMIGYGVVLFVSTYVQVAAFIQVAGTTAAGRAAFAASMTALARQLSYILPQPFRLDTLDGYVQWRAYGPLALVVLVWAIAAAAAVRGDEDKQVVGYWLAARVSRARLVAGRLAAFGLAALVAVALGLLGYMAGAARYEQVNLGGAAGKVLALWLLILTLFAL